MLPPTSSRLRDPDAVPYFLWDLGLTNAAVREVLASGDASARDRTIAHILREANSRDVWLFLSWSDILDAWPRIQHRLGRARPVWQLMIDRHEEHERTAAAA